MRNDIGIYRGKSNITGEWLIGNLLYDGKHAQIWVDTQNGKQNYEVDPKTLGEYTGQKDINETMIFEGDIVSYPIEQGRFKDSYTHTVVFEQRGGSAYFGITMSEIETWYFCLEVPSKLMEVVGNIYDSEALMTVIAEKECLKAKHEQPNPLYWDGMPKRREDTDDK